MQSVVRQVEVAQRSFEFSRRDLEQARAAYVGSSEAFDSLTHRKVGIYMLSPEESESIRAYAEATHLLTFRIETSFFQARILLDRIARLLHFAFQPAQTAIGSHAHLARNFPALVAEHGTSVLEKLMSRINDLTKDVKNFRDRYLVHPSGPHGHRVRSTPQWIHPPAQPV